MTALSVPAQVIWLPPASLGTEAGAKDLSAPNGVTYNVQSCSDIACADGVTSLPGSATCLSLTESCAPGGYQSWTIPSTDALALYRCLTAKLVA